MDRVHKNGKLSTTDIVYCGMFAALIVVRASIKKMCPERTVNFEHSSRTAAGHLIPITYEYDLKP